MPTGYADSGSYFTPPGVASRRRLADSMMAAGLDASPIRHWTQGLGRLAQAMVGGYGGWRADEKEREGLNELGGILGGSLPVPNLPSVGKPGTGTPAAPTGAAMPTAAPSTPPSTPDDFTRWVQGREGFSAQPYGDFRQTSIGYGTRARPGETSITPADAAGRLQDELGQARVMVRAFAPSLSPGQENALTDLTYNAGPGWMQSGLGQAVRSGNWPEAQRLFQLYVNAGGQRQPGLVTRRNAAAPWLTTTTPAEGAPLPPPMRLGGPRPEDAANPANDPLIGTQQPIPAGGAPANAVPSPAGGDPFAGDWSVGQQPEPPPDYTGLGGVGGMTPEGRRAAQSLLESARAFSNRYLLQPSTLGVSEPAAPATPAAPPAAAPAPGAPPPATSITQPPGTPTAVPGVTMGSPASAPPPGAPEPPAAAQAPPARPPAAAAQTMPATDVIRRLLQSRNPQAIQFGLQLYRDLARRGPTADYDFQAVEGSLYRINKRTGAAELVAGTGQGKPPEAIRTQGIKADQAYRNLSTALDDYERLVTRTGITALPGQDRDAVTQARTNIQLQLKELYNLGALAGPDLELMNKMLPDTDIGFGNMGSNPAERVGPAVARLREILRGIRNSQTSAIGLPPAQPRQGGADGFSIRRLD